MSQVERGDKQNEVSRDAVYKQLYHEMRRHRDYERLISGWYSTLALGAIAGLLSIPRIGIRLDTWLVWFLVTVIAIAGAGVCYVVCYSHDRYQSLRKYTNEKIEPSWKQKPQIPEKKLKPHHILIVINAALTIAIIVVLVRLN